MSTPIHSMYSSSSAQNHGDSAHGGASSNPPAGAYDDAITSPDLDGHHATDPLRPHYGDGYDPDSNPGSRRESYMDSDLEMRKYQGLSASGVQGYQAVTGDHSEPGSPTGENGSYERSHESGSSGTKVETPGGQRHQRPDTMSSDGSYDMRAGGAHTVSNYRLYRATGRTAS